MYNSMHGPRGHTYKPQPEIREYTLKLQSAFPGKGRNSDYSASMDEIDTNRDGVVC